MERQIRYIASCLLIILSFGLLFGLVLGCSTSESRTVRAATEDYLACEISGDYASCYDYFSATRKAALRRQHQNFFDPASAPVVDGASYQHYRESIEVEWEEAYIMSTAKKPNGQYEVSVAIKSISEGEASESRVVLTWTKEGKRWVLLDQLGR